MVPPASRSRELFLLLGLFAAVCWPLINSLQTSNHLFDELNYHLPAVRQIADHWPALDLAADSLSATAPGYHYALATVAQLTGDGMRRMRFVNWALSAGLLAMIYLYARRRLSSLDASLLVAPLAASNFFIKSASWVVTDNPALFLVALSLFTALKPALSPSARLGLSLASAASVFIRQLTIWTAALPIARCVGHPVLSWKNQRREILVALLMSVPALLVLALLYRAWGGLVPPAWSDTSLRLSTAGPVYLLSVIALFGGFFVPADSLRAAWAKPTRLATLLIFMAGVLFSLTTETTHSYTAGRWGGYLWILAMQLPILAGHSLLFAFLCGLGLTFVFVFWRSLREHNEPQAASVFLLGLTAFAATFLVNRQIFHRYFEPTVFLFLIAIGPLLLAKAAHLSSWRWRMGACGLIQLIATVYTTHAVILFER